MSQEPLFEVQPVARLQRGDKVRLQTMWGIEFCDVVKVVIEEDFPMVTLKTQSGDKITINIARVQAVEVCEECGNDEVCEGYKLCTECLERGTR